MRCASTLIILALALSCRAQAATDAEELMQRNFRATKVQVLSTESTMLLIGKNAQTRTRKVSALARLKPNGVDSDVMIEFLQPPDVRGTRFLQQQNVAGQDDMWIYLPALHKARRLVASNKRDSFVGTDFSYGDILPPAPENFRNQLLREEPLDGIDCYVVESIAKDGAYERDLGYGRRLLWVRKDNAIELKVDYYDSAGRLVKTQTTAKHVLVDSAAQRWVVQQRQMVDHDSGHRTLITVDKLDAQASIPARAFRAESLGER